MQAWQIKENLPAQEEGPTQEEVATLLELELRAWETQWQENSFWQELAVSSYQSRTYQAVRPQKLIIVH